MPSFGMAAVAAVTLSPSLNLSSLVYTPPSEGAMMNMDPSATYL